MEKKFVAPGDLIGTEEEYLAGAGTYSENEKIYAAVGGKLEEKARKLSVVQEKPLHAFGKGDIIIGTVENVVEPIALVRIHFGSGNARFGHNPGYAVLHASMIKKGYVKNVRDEYKIGDIIRAKIVDIREGELRLATDSDELGAIKAYCAKNRSPMKLESGILKSEVDGWKDSRKIAKDYRKADINL